MAFDKSQPGKCSFSTCGCHWQSESDVSDVVQFRLKIRVTVIFWLVSLQCCNCKLQLPLHSIRVAPMQLAEVSQCCCHMSFLQSSKGAKYRMHYPILYPIRDTRAVCVVSLASSILMNIHEHWLQ